MNILNLMDTPRLYTALAEWAACFAYIIVLKKKRLGKKIIFYLIGILCIQIIYQYIAGMLPLFLWVGGMIGAIMIMYFAIKKLCDLSNIEALFYTMRAFVLAEFSASFQWQLYVWWALRYQKNSGYVSVLIMSVCYLIVFTVYYFIEKGHLHRDKKLNIEFGEMIGAMSIALGAFIISNISFMMPNTPFSSETSSILYVRSLVDFGGLAMLFAQQYKREKLRMWSENNAMNTVLQRHYDQYRIAQDNMELLRREFHNLKHYMIAIKAEKDIEKKEQYLVEMENAIHVQEALSNTGNKVLDVVLTTKSLFCTQNDIIFNCMLDGNLMNFMSVKDICSVFGNALDNAIECVIQFDDLDKRIITVSAYKKNRFLIIQFENYTESNIILNNSILSTTKVNKEFHGYGLKSIRLIAQKYSGTMTVHSNKNIFMLQLLFPI